MNDHLSIQEATKFFSEFYGGEHHLPRSGIKAFGYGFAVTHIGDLATFDFDMLTKLVVMAHDFCYRSSISTSGINRIKIAIWKRNRDGGFTERHPTIEENISLVRKKFNQS